MEKQVTGQEAALPIEEYAEKQGLGRRAAGQYVKLGRMETGKVKDETSVIDVPARPETGEETSDLPAQDIQTESIAEIIQAAKMDWIHFGIIQAQAKSKTRWQTYAFFLTVLFVGVLLANIWLYMDRAMYARQLEQVLGEFGAAKMKLTAANAAVDGTKQLQDENNQLAIENTALKAQNALLFRRVESFNESGRNSEPGTILAVGAPQVNLSVQQEKAESKPVKEALDTSGEKGQEKLSGEMEKRRSAIQKGLYPKDLTRDELIASLGEPDRIYQGPVYEQLVYL